MSKTQIPADWPQQNVDDSLLISDTPPGLNTMMPNGKKFGDCTGAEIGLIGQIMSEYRAERLAEEERMMGRDLDERYVTRRNCWSYLPTPTGALLRRWRSSRHG